MSTSDILDQEFNTASAEELLQCDDIAKALEIVNKENPYSKLPPKKEVTVQDMFKPKQEVTTPKNYEDMSINELLEEDALDELAEEAEHAFRELLVNALNSSPKCMAEIAATAAKFLETKKDALLAKVDNRMKRTKLELDRLKIENKPTKKAESDSIEIETLPTITAL